MFEAVYPLKEEPKAFPKTRQCSYGDPYSLSLSLSLSLFAQLVHRTRIYR